LHTGFGFYTTDFFPTAVGVIFATHCTLAVGANITRTRTLPQRTMITFGTARGTFSRLVARSDLAIRALLAKFAMNILSAYIAGDAGAGFAVANGILLLAIRITVTVGTKLTMAGSQVAYLSHRAGFIAITFTGLQLSVTGHARGAIGVGIAKTGTNFFGAASAQK